jgi:hypothetical protein
MRALMRTLRLKWHTLLQSRIIFLELIDSKLNTGLIFAFYIILYSIRQLAGATSFFLLGAASCDAAENKKYPFFHKKNKTNEEIW